MSYTIQRFSVSNGEPLPPEVSHPSITVDNFTADLDQTTVPLLGTDFRLYSREAMEASLWRTNNFAYSMPPLNPLNGQIWFDTSSNSLRVNTGADYTTDLSDWETLSSQSLSDINESIIPTSDNTYVLGSSTKVWKEVRGDTIYVTSSLLSRGIVEPLNPPLYVDVADLVTDSALTLENASTVEAADVSSAIAILGSRNPPSSVVVEAVVPTSATHNLTPEDGVRYRFLCDFDFTVNLLFNGGSNTALSFELISAGLGKMTVGGDPEIEIRRNSNFASSTCTYAYATLIDRSFIDPNDPDILPADQYEIESWNMIGNFHS